MARKELTSQTRSAIITTTTTFTGPDSVEYSRMRRNLIDTLQNLGGYEPAIDDILIDEIARIVIYSRKTETFLNSKTATEYTYSRVADIKVKFAKIVDNAVRQLAISRRDRLTTQTQSNLIAKIKETILQGLKDDAGESAS